MFNYTPEYKISSDSQEAVAGSTRPIAGREIKNPVVVKAERSSTSALALYTSNIVQSAAVADGRIFLGKGNVNYTSVGALPPAPTY